MTRRKTGWPALHELCGMSREEAARYIGVSPTKFDQLVKEGSMPKPRWIGGRRKVWSRSEIELAFHALPREGEVQEDNPIDKIEAI